MPLSALPSGNVCSPIAVADNRPEWVDLTHSPDRAKPYIEFQSQPRPVDVGSRRAVLNFPCV